MRAPEVILYEETGSIYNPLYADLWGLGVVLYFMLYKSLPFKEEQLKQGLPLDLKFPEASHYNSTQLEQLNDLCSSLLCNPPEKRLNCSAILAHQSLKSVRGTVSDAILEKNVKCHLHQQDKDEYKRISKRIKDPYPAYNEMSIIFKPARSAYKPEE